ncbi:MAG: hypothetical protein M1324_01880 [Patescibacteria group bacterium]|nr:hypothetical protein [Patescibacteria group bacterium]
MKSKHQQIKNLTPEQIEDLFAARLAKIFVDQILERKNITNIIKTADKK